MAMVGKLRGWDRTVSTPTVDWRSVIVDVVPPAKNEEKAIALALSSLAKHWQYRSQNQKAKGYPVITLRVEVSRRDSAFSADPNPWTHAAQVLKVISRQH